jgi:DNA-binding CsgD family transcriptional regulator
MISLALNSDVPQRLSDVVNAEGFAARALDVIQHVQGAKDEAAMLELLYAAKVVLGAEQAVFSSFIRDDETHESFRFLIAADPVWCVTYQQKAWYAKDPWLLYAMTATEPACDTAIPLRTKSQREARSLAAEYGIASAYIVPAPSGNGISRLGVLVLGSSVPGYFETPATSRLRVLAQGLAMSLHAWRVRWFRKEIISTYRLNGEDIQLMKLEREGKSTKEIATTLDISPASVDSRFQRLNAKFNQPNRRATAQLAAEYGLL